MRCTPGLRSVRYPNSDGRVAITMSRIRRPPKLRTINSSNRFSTPPSWRTEIAISENDSSVPIIQQDGGGKIGFSRGRFWRLGIAQNARLDGSDHAAVPCFSCCGAYSASGWFSGRALSKAGSFRQAASTAAIFGYFAKSTLKRRALKTWGTRQRSATVTCAPNA